MAFVSFNRKPVISECLPDGTVKVENPNVGVYSHVFAVQDEGVSAAVKCTVSTSGAQSNITGCSQVNEMHVILMYSGNIVSKCKILPKQLTLLRSFIGIHNR